MYCPVWQPKCIFHLARISQTKQADCHRRSMFSSIDHLQYPIYDRVRRNSRKRLMNRRDWSERRSLDLNELEVFLNIFLKCEICIKIDVTFELNWWTNQFGRPIFVRSRQNFPTQLNYFVDWNCNKTRNYCDLSVFSNIFQSWAPKFSVSYHRCHWPINDCHWTKQHH